MVCCLLLYIGNQRIQTNTYSGTATIISQLNTVSLVPSPIGPKLSIEIFPPPKPNLKKAEAQTLREIQRDREDRQDYINQSNKLFIWTSLQGYPQGPHLQNEN